MKKELKARIAQDIEAVSLLNTLPHIAIIFTAVSAAQAASLLLWFSKGEMDFEQGFPNFESVLVFMLMIPVLIQYKMKKKLPITNKHALFTKLSIACFILGFSLVAASTIVPMLSLVASGGSLIIAGLLATLLQKRIYLNSTSKEQREWMSTYKDLKE